MTDNNTNLGIRQRRLRGVVVSDRMDKTIRVKITRLKMNSKYRKQYKVSQTYMVHDPENTYHMGETVIFEADRPRSKSKRWVAVSRVGEAKEAKTEV